MKQIGKITAGMVAALVFLGSSAVQAAVVTYGAPTTIPHDSDGSFLATDGVLKIAANLAGSNTINSNIVVNGITFNNKHNGEFFGDEVTLKIVAPGGGVSGNSDDPGYADAAGLGQMVRGLAFSSPALGGSGEIAMSLTGLTIGKEYRLQTIYLQNGTAPNLRATTIQNGSIVAPSNNQSSVISYSGSFEAGFISLSWTADATEQDFILLSTPPATNDWARSVINAAVLHVMETPEFTVGAPVSVPDDSGSVFQNGGVYLLGMNIADGGATVSTINGVAFHAGGLAGRIQSRTDNGVTALVTADTGGFVANNVAAGIYTDTGSSDEIFDIMDKGFVTSFGSAGSVDIQFSGLTVGQTYRMQTFHLNNTGDRLSRDMVYPDGGLFSNFFDATGTNVIAAVAETVQFTATDTTKTLALLPAGPSRGYLNGLALYKVVAFEAWMAQFPSAGSETNQMDNPDNDSLNNLYEWALGGDPTNGADIGHVPVYGILEDGGSTWLEYTYAKRNDAASLGLTYHLEQTTDLVDSWVDGNYDVVDTGVLDGEFDAVTNRVSTEVESEQFLRLIVETN